MNEKWYKNPWVWLVIALPASAVIAGIATVIITSANQPEMVVDDYYKKGKGINKELTLYNKAHSLGIDLKIKVNDDRITLVAKQKFPALKANFIHSTLGDLDFDTVLTPNSKGEFTALLDNKISGKWQVIITPMDTSWKVKGVLALPYDDWTAL